MRDLQLEERIGHQKVCGINGLDLRQAMLEVFISGELTPEIFREQLTIDFASSQFFETILDIASFAAQCALREANGLIVPDWFVNCTPIAGDRIFRG